MTYPATVNSPQGLELGKEPCKGRVAFKITLDFSQGLTQTVDFAQYYQQGTIKSIQTIYCDNSGGADPITFQFSQTQQQIIIPGTAEQYFNVLQPNSPVFTVSCTNAARVVVIHVLNFFVPPAIWGQTFTVDIPAIDAIIVNGRLNVRSTPAPLTADTDRSGTITAGGTGQVLMAANSARLQWSLQNPSTATELLQFSKNSIAGPWYDLVAGAFAGNNGATIYTGTIWVIAATTAHRFTADEGT